MADGQEPSTPNENENPTGNPEAGAGQEPGQGAGESQPPKTSKTYDEAYVTQLRREAGDYRTQLRNAQASLTQLQQREQEYLSGKMTMQQELEFLKSENARLKIGSAALDVASQLGAIYPEAVVKLLDQAGIEFDDKQNPKNIKELLVKIRTKYPAMFRNVNPVNGASGAQGGPTPSSMTQMIRQAAGLRD